MHIYTSEIKEKLDSTVKYREMLFRRGYLFTDKRIENKDAYPFYGLWNELNIKGHYLYVQQKQTYYAQSNRGGVCVILVGHAYNPFNKEIDENVICKELLDSYEESLEKYFDKISELTGLHIIILIDNGKVRICQDACGLTGCYFGMVNGNMYVTEHPQLIADLCGLTMNPMVEKLISSKCYNIGNRHLPGSLTPYKELKRIGANTYVEYNSEHFEVKRFYPIKAHPEFRTKDEKEKAVQQIGELIHNGIDCCSRKWERCAISLSGGTDSKTTLTCANGLYDRFSIFSFHSKPQELVDANAAHDICTKLGLDHTIYNIPESNDEIEDFDFIKKLLQHNTNYFVNLADNEIRKYVFLHDMDVFDIELKSWASEVARVFLERKYDLDMSGIINERQCSVFQTRYFGHPKLLRWSDGVYRDFLKEVGLDKQIYNYEPSDMFYWEVRMGAWGVSVTSSQQFYHRVTMPINNRKILELFLGFPHEERKTDSVHKAVMAQQNPKVLEANVEVPNLYFHSYRIMMEKVYYLFRTKFFRSRLNK